MAINFMVELEDRPGALAELGEALGRAGINILGGCGMLCNNRGRIHVLVEDADAARQALREADIKMLSERPVLVREIEDRPGALGDQARRIANAGLNIDLIYLTAAGQLVLGVDDLDKARMIV